ncbi:MAG: hypothetical protein GY861_06035 [bacterium]|nr:hypothetical protein [bacterium]
MDEKDIIEQLKSLKEVKPDADWKTSNRDLLFSQVSASVTPEVKVSFLMHIFNFAKQPAMAVILVVLVIGGGFGVRFTSKSKPGDSLYIAKVISEKAQLAVTFNKNKKSRLETKFASQRAKDITVILADPSYDPSEDEERHEKLAASFKKEISIVRDSIKDIEQEDSEDGNEETDDDSAVFSAGLGKTEDGIKISTGKDDIEDEVVEVVENLEVEEEKVDVATSTDVAELEDNKDSEDQKEILEQAEKLFEEKDYEGTLEKLEEIEVMMDKDGEVKGVSEEVVGTSSSDIIVE